MGVATAPEPTAARAAGALLTSLYDRHSRMVVGVCRLLLRDPHDAEDAAQQAFLSAYRSILGGTVPRNAGAWLAEIARNECRGRMAERARRPLPIADPDDAAGIDTADLALNRGEMERLHGAIAELPDRQREAVLLRDFYGLSYTEVASALTVSVPVVESLLFRARRGLKSKLGGTPTLTYSVWAVPASLRDQLGALVPGFGQAEAAVASGIGSIAVGALAKAVAVPAAKFGALPSAGKLAATLAGAAAVGAGVATPLTQGGSEKSAERNPPRALAAATAETSAVGEPADTPSGTAGSTQPASSSGTRDNEQATPVGDARASVGANADQTSAPPGQASGEPSSAGQAGPGLDDSATTEALDDRSGPRAGETEADDDSSGSGERGGDDDDAAATDGGGRSGSDDDARSSDDDADSRAEDDGDEDDSNAADDRSGRSGREEPDDRPSSGSSPSSGSGSAAAQDDSTGGQPAAGGDGTGSGQVSNSSGSSGKRSSGKGSSGKGSGRGSGSSGSGGAPKPAKPKPAKPKPPAPANDDAAPDQGSDDRPDDDDSDRSGSSGSGSGSSSSGSGGSGSSGSDSGTSGSSGSGSSGSQEQDATGEGGSGGDDDD